MTPNNSFCILKIYLSRTYSTASYYFYPQPHLRQYCYCWGLRPLLPEPLLSLLLMGVTDRSVFVLAVGQGTYACAGQRGSGCDSYNCCCCPSRTTSLPHVPPRGGLFSKVAGQRTREAWNIMWPASSKGGMRRCWEGKDQGWGVVYICAVGGAGAGAGAGAGVEVEVEGRDYRHQARHRRLRSVWLWLWLRLQVFEKKAKWCPCGGPCHPQWRWELR